MNKILKLFFFSIFIHSFTFVNELYCQNIFQNQFNSHITKQENSESNNYIFANSVGLSFDKSKPAIYISVSRRITDKIFLGIRGGYYNGKENIDDLIYDTFIHEPVPVGFYKITGNAPPIEQNPWLIGLQGDYSILQNFSANVAIGIKSIEWRTYNGIHITYTSDGSSILGFNYTLDREYESKKVTKLFFSAGVDYAIANFRAGIFADNIFSAGITAGFSF